VTARSPVVRLLGLAVFVLGCVMLAFAIIGLLPGDGGFATSSALFTQLLVNILMLMVATFMASIGMFFLVYGGEIGAPEVIEE
jgi:hypothetical protein